MKPFWHNLHKCGNCLVWFVIWWLVKLYSWVKDLSQNEHLYGLSFLWILMCLVRLPFRPNFLPHWSQTKLLILSWTVFTWLSKLLRRLNILSQPWHWCFDSLLWIDLICLVRPPFCVNFLSQTVHLNAFTFVWVTSCRLSLLGQWNE